MQSKWVEEECSHLHCILTHLIRKKAVFANHTKTGAVTAQLMSATKIEEKLRLLPSIVFVHPGLSPIGRYSALKTCFLASGPNNDFFAYMRKHRRRPAMR